VAEGDIVMGMVALTAGVPEPLPSFEAEGPKEEETLTEVEGESDNVVKLDGEEDDVPLTVGEWLISDEVVIQPDDDAE